MIRAVSRSSLAATTSWSRRIESMSSTRPARVVARRTITIEQEPLGRFRGSADAVRRRTGARAGGVGGPALPKRWRHDGRRLPRRTLRRAASRSCERSIGNVFPVPRLSVDDRLAEGDGRPFAHRTLTPRPKIMTDGTNRDDRHRGDLRMAQHVVAEVNARQRVSLPRFPASVP